MSVGGRGAKEAGSALERFLDEAAKRFGGGLLVAAVITTSFVVTYKQKIELLEARLQESRSLIEAVQSTRFSDKDAALLRSEFERKLDSLRFEIRSMLDQVRKIAKSLEEEFKNSHEEER